MKPVYCEPSEKDGALRCRSRSKNTGQGCSRISSLQIMVSLPFEHATQVGRERTIAMVMIVIRSPSWKLRQEDVFQVKANAALSKCRYTDLGRAFEL